MALSRKTPLKRGTGTLKRSTGLKRKPKTKEQIQQNKEDGQRMMELFDEHWLLKTKQGGYHYCESCGCAIYGENKTIYHHHCWPKSKHPEHALKVEGLMLLCWQCHSNIENGIMSNETREKIEEIKARVT